MIKKKFIQTTSLLLMYVATGTYAQVGINTEFPMGMLHIDGQRDNETNPSDIQQENDFIIDYDGNVGIGTVTPTEKLEVNASRIAVRDNSEGQGKVLVSDANGLGTWTTVSDNGRTVIWEVAGKRTLTGNYDILTGSAVSLTGDEELLLSGGFRKSTSYGTTTLIVPQGLYLILVSMQAVKEREYGKLQIWKGENPSTTAHVDYNSYELYKIFYREQLTGSTFVHEFTEDTPIHATIRLNPANNALYTNFSYWSPPPINDADFDLKIRFVKLNH